MFKDFNHVDPLYMESTHLRKCYGMIGTMTITVVIMEYSDTNVEVFDKNHSKNALKALKTTFINNLSKKLFLFTVLYLKS